jgi:hypothetical protein
MTINQTNLVPLFSKKKKNDKHQVIDISTGKSRRKGLGTQIMKCKGEPSSQRRKGEDKFRIS